METVYFATNRQPYLAANARDDDDIAGFGPELGPTSGIDVRYGKAEVEVDIRKSTSRLNPGSLFIAPQKLVVAQGESPLWGSNTIFEAVRRSMKNDNKPTIVLIHGFSNSFTDSIERAAWIRKFYAIDANMFAFSWPSQASAVGTPLPYVDYEHDRTTAAASGIAIARTIRRLYDFVQGLASTERCEQSIHLICHSMGNYVLRGALQALLQLPDQPSAVASSAVSRPVPGQPLDPSVLRRYFDKIVLAAADEDADAFDDPAKFKFLPRLGQTVTVYYTHKDWVLGTLSNVTKFNGPRLGYDGPDNMGSINDKITAVDVSATIDTFKEPENHQYYRVFARVRDDIVAVLSGTSPDKVKNRTSIGPGRWRLELKKGRDDR